MLIQYGVLILYDKPSLEGFCSLKGRMKAPGRCKFTRKSEFGDQVSGAMVSGAMVFRDQMWLKRGMGALYLYHSCSVFEFQEAAEGHI